MQGRLSPPEDGRFQAFPRRSWLEEFPRAREASLDYIEWIHAEYGAPRTQSSNQADLAEFDVLKRHYGIAARDLCGDWFMDLPLIRCTTVELAQREQHLHKLIVLPLVDQPKITTEDEKQVVIDVLQRALPIAQSHHVELHLEADFNPID
jgi:hexulose-6-phosphate isomerase